MNCYVSLDSRSTTESSTSSSFLPRDAWNWCALKTPGLCSTSCTSTATTQSVSSLSGIVTRRPLDHHKNLGDTMAAIFRTCSGSGEICGTPSPELIEQVKDSPVEVYKPFQAN